MTGSIQELVEHAIFRCAMSPATPQVRTFSIVWSLGNGWLTEEAREELSTLGRVLERDLAASTVEALGRVFSKGRDDDESARLGFLWVAGRSLKALHRGN